MIDKIWDGNEPYIIAEVSQNHDGSLGQAHAFIDAVATTGADAIKFQTHIAEAESTIYEPFRVKFSYEDATRYDYWKRMEFSEDQWKELYEHARDKNLDFLSSPFSVEALEMLDRIGVSAWKFGAGEVFNNVLLDKAIQTRKPILLSTGLSTYADIESQIKKIESYGNKFLIFQCTTAYPSRADMIDISLIKEYMDRFKCKVGISDHSATIYPALAATTLGASAIEVHVTLSEYMFGPDVKASVTIPQLKSIVDGAKFIATMNSVKSDMNRRTESREELKAMFSKSLYLRTDINKGQKITQEMLIPKKPNLGIDSNDIFKIIGKSVNKDLKQNEPLKWEDVD